MEVQKTDHYLHSYQWTPPPPRDRSYIMTGLTVEGLSNALEYLRDLGCDDLNPFVLAVAAWSLDPDEPLHRVGEAMTLDERIMFNELHRAAADRLRVSPGHLDLRPLSDRDDHDSITELCSAYKWAALVQAKHTDRLRERQILWLQFETESAA